MKVNGIKCEILTRPCDDVEIVDASTGEVLAVVSELTADELELLHEIFE